MISTRISSGTPPVIGGKLRTPVSTSAAQLGSIFEVLVANPLQFQDALKALLNYSLIQRHSTTHTLTLHRLVQAVLKGHLSDVQRALHITEHALSPTHPQTAFPLTNLAEISQHLGKYDVAELLYQRAL